MKKITVFIAAAAMTLGVQLQACNNGKTVEAENAIETTTEAATTAKAEDAVEEFTSSSVLPDKTDVPIVIDFNAVWCGPCQYFKPVFHEVAAEYRGKARFISVNVDNNRELAMKFKVRSIPQITIVRPDGQVVSTVGAMEKADFEKFLKDNL